MISLDESKCTRCGLCIRRFQDYCIRNNNGVPDFDRIVCNLCQKCAAICPFQAILVNGVSPEKIDPGITIEPGSLEYLLAKRRSCKLFQDRQLPADLLRKIVQSAGYAPNQNKNISLIVITSQEVIRWIDQRALIYFQGMYKLLFGIPPLTAVFQLFTPSLSIIKRKMERDLFQLKRIVKKNAQALVLLTGNSKEAVTKESAPYLFANMIITAEALGIGSCLMDSLKMAVNGDKKITKKLDMSHTAFGVLALGYSDENIVNIPRGYQTNNIWKD